MDFLDQQYPLDPVYRTLHRAMRECLIARIEEWNKWGHPECSEMEREVLESLEDGEWEKEDIRDFLRGRRGFILEWCDVKCPSFEERETDDTSEFTRTVRVNVSIMEIFAFYLIREVRWAFEEGIRLKGSWITPNGEQVWIN